MKSIMLDNEFCDFQDDQSIQTKYSSESTLSAQTEED